MGTTLRHRDKVQHPLYILCVHAFFGLVRNANPDDSPGGRKNLPSQLPQRLQKPGCPAKHHDRMHCQHKDREPIFGHEGLDCDELGKQRRNKEE